MIPSISYALSITRGGRTAASLRYGGLDEATVGLLLGIVEFTKQILFLAELAHLDMGESVISKEQILILSIFFAIATELAICCKKNLGLSL